MVAYTPPSVMCTEKTLFDPDGMLPLAMAPAAFTVRMKDELAQWKKIVADRNIVAE